MAQPIRLAIVLAASVSACGKDTSSPRGKVDRHDPVAATETKRKPCDYVKRADAEKAVGLALPGTFEDIPLHECSYNTPDPRGTSAALTVGASVTNSEWDQCMMAFSSSSPEKIANVGDEALFIREHLIVRKGERCLSVSIDGPFADAEPDDGLARVTGLALAILPTF